MKIELDVTGATIKRFLDPDGAYNFNVVIPCTDGDGFEGWCIIPFQIEKSAQDYLKKLYDKGD